MGPVPSSGPMDSEPVPRLAYSIREFAEAAGVSRAQIYVLLQRGEVRSVKLGGRRLIPASEADRLFGADRA